jgi:hypothetical protein
MKKKQDMGNNINDNKNYKKKRRNDTDFTGISANAAKSFTDLWQ